MTKTLFAAVATLAALAAPAFAAGGHGKAKEGPPALLDAAIAAERALIEAYDAVMASDPDPRLAAIRAQHQAHLEALGASDDPASASSAGPSATRGSLVALERDAAVRARQDCLEAEDPELVRTLAFIAASEASHAPALRAGA